MNVMRNTFLVSLVALLVSLSSGILWAAEPKADTKDPLVELANIAGKMGEAETRLADGKAGNDTLKLQAEIIAALDCLIELAQRKPKPEPDETGESRCETCRNKSTPCGICRDKNGNGQDGNTPATRPGDRDGGPADDLRNDPNDPSNSIRLRPKYGEAGRHLDDEDVVPGFENLLERFYKAIWDAEQEEN